jgi:hypothetical protein
MGTVQNPSKEQDVSKEEVKEQIPVEEAFDDF